MSTETNKAFINTQKQLRIIQLAQPYIDLPFHYGSCDCHIITAEIIDAIRGTTYADGIKGKYHDLESAIEYHKNGELKLNTVLRKEFVKVFALEPMDLIVFPSIKSHSHLLWYLGNSTCVMADQTANRIHSTPTPDLKGARLYRLKNKEQ